MNMQLGPYPFPMVQPGPYNYLNRPVMAPPLYVGDIDENIHDETLHDFFSNFGVLQFVRIMRDQTTGKSRGFAYVNFMNPRDAENARNSAQYEKIGRKHIRIMFKTNMRELSSDANLYVKNLDPSVTVKDLHAYFAQWFTVVSAKVATDSEGKSLGYGYVQFEKKEDAEKALKEFQGSRLKENELVLEQFVPKDRRTGHVEKRNIYVKNLPSNKSEEELNKAIETIFSKYGEIETHMVKKHPVDNKFSAFVCYKEEKAAQDAFDDLKNSPQTIPGSDEPLYVNWHQGKSERLHELKRQFQQTQNKTNLFVKNIKPDVDENTLKAGFQQFGQIVSVALKEWVSKDATKKAKFGYVNFANAEDAGKAVAEAVSIQEIKDFFLPEAQPYIGFHQSKDNRREFLASQNKGKMQQANMMRTMGGFPGMPQMPGMAGRRFPPFPAQMMPFKPPMNKGGAKPHPGMWGNAGGRGGPTQRGGFGGRPFQRGPREGGPREGGPREGGPREGGPRDGQQRRQMPPQQMGQHQQQNFGNRPTGPGIKAPVQNQPQTHTQPKPQQQTQAQTPAFNMEEFMSLDENKQRMILGEMLFPRVQQISGGSLAPKITGMIIDLTVLEVSEILEFLENNELLVERVEEAMELIKSEGQ
jgi:polyadenylate-binding protein